MGELANSNIFPYCRRIRGSRSAWFGVDYSAPFPMQNSVFFPNLYPKFSQFDSLKKKWKSGEKNDPSLSQAQLVKAMQHLIQKYQGQNTWFLKVCLVFFFPILRKTLLFFRIPRAPGPSPKNGCESPGIGCIRELFNWSRELSNSITECCKWISALSYFTHIESSLIELESSAIQIEHSLIHFRIS